MPSERQLSSFYPDNFYAYQPYEENTQPVREFIKKMLGHVIHTKDPIFSIPGRFLDLGCGSGEFMVQYKKSGWEVWGVEPNIGAAEYGQHKKGLNIFAGNLLDAHFNAGYFDYIRANHSLEHIPNPNEVFEELRRVIKPEGLLHIGVPNIRSLNAHIFGQYWWYLGAPVHTFNYCVDTLVKFGEKHGFVADRIQFNSDYAGTLGSLQIFLNRNGSRKSNEGALINSSPARVIAQWCAKVFDVIRQGDVIEITFRPR